MEHEFPSAVPEIPVSDVDAAVAYYNQLGFSLDWRTRHGIAGISRGSCRLFLTGSSFRKKQNHGNEAPVLIWLNLNSKQEVDDLYEEWSRTQARILSRPESKPWNLHEFTVSDLDGNLFHVVYDFTGENDGADAT